MAASDAILIGEDWISEHYFSTDATSQSFHARVLAQRKEWDAAETPTVRSRFTAARGDLETALADLLGGNGRTTDGTSAVGAAPRFDADAARRVYARLRDVLGYTAGGYHLDAAGPVLRVSAPGITAGAPLVLIEARPVEAVDDLLEKDAPTLLEPVAFDEKTTLTSVPRLLSALFVADDAPSFALVMAGRWLLVAEKDRWAEGRYLGVDLQLVCERNRAAKGGEIDRALTCVAADSLAPDAEGDIRWSATLEESIKHTVGVSKDLREGVRLSIEIIANEVVTRRRHRGLDPLPAEQAQPLAKQSLRFLYRILFLLYAEASPELGVLPVGASEYEQGYSLDRLRDLTLVELISPHARTGIHLYESLAVLYRLVDAGHQPSPPDRTSGRRADGAAEEANDGAASDLPAGVPDGLTFQALRADLFLPAATALIDEVGLGNEALQRVLRHLLLSKESGGRDRGFISYAELGINQLGAVYEGLMSYTGFFAETDLYEVAKNGDPSKGSWVVPVERAGGIAEADFVRTTDPLTGEKKAVLHERGTFVFRLAGRDRQQSASYYTPEVLTRFTVSQALEELLDQHGTTTPAADILTMTICEPALGSGAFAIEAVRQMAAEYLSRRQKETGAKIDPDAYPRELQQVKAYLALHNVYGVDLNPTAVELAEISLWLDTMVEGLKAPWFGLHLRRGNSLIGARRATYSRAQVNDKSWLTATPTNYPLTDVAGEMRNGSPNIATSGRIHHFLLPAHGWGAAVEAKEATVLAPDATKALNTWRSAIHAKPTANQVADLVDLAHRVEALWQLALRRLQIAETEARRSIPIWRHGAELAGGEITREQIETSLADPNGAYRRLRRVMNAWTALWFWPLTETNVNPPTLQQWIDACRSILGRHMEASRRSPKGMAQLGSHLDWEALGDAEVFDLSFAGAEKVEAVLDAHPWLRVCERVAELQGFFHWELDFATVFARGGFGLQIGNPPWVQPEFSLADAITEIDPRHSFAPGVLGGSPWWQEGKVSGILADGAGSVASISRFLRGISTYPLIGEASVDLYKSFLERSWSHAHPTGAVALVHSPSLYQEEKASRLRRESYARLRRLWHFSNERKLFSEIGNRVTFVCTVHRSPRPEIGFINACYLLEPQTAERSLLHDGAGSPPNIKDDDGRWDLRPHLSRIRNISGLHFSAWALDEANEGGRAREGMLASPFMFAVNNRLDIAIAALGRADNLGSVWNFVHWLGIGETSGVKEGLIVRKWARVSDLDNVVLQGPHLSVNNPVSQNRGVEMKSHRDWVEVDPESLTVSPEWCTGYQLGDRVRVERLVPRLSGVSAGSLYRVAWRRRGGAAGIRTLQPAIIPPGVKHIETIVSIADVDWSAAELALLCGVLSSLTLDFQIRVAQKSDIRPGLLKRLRVPTKIVEFGADIALRTLRLNCLNESYAPLWNSWQSVTGVSPWSSAPPSRIRSSEAEIRDVLSEQWSPRTPLRTFWGRRQAQLEIDVLVAMAFGLGADELIDIYDAQFGVMKGAERGYAIDAFGRVFQCPVALSAPESGDPSRRSHPEGVPMDREASMRQAYAHFDRILAQGTAGGSE